MKAKLSNYRQSPRKVRLVADLIKGKSIERALIVLDKTPKLATKQITKLIKSAVSNSSEKKNLYIKSLRVDDGVTMKRIRPRARGSAYLVRGRTSNIILELGKKSKKGKAVEEKKISQVNEKKTKGKNKKAVSKKSK